MTTKTDDIKLPPLAAMPAADHYSSTIVVTLEQAEDAIRAAVEADRQRRGEPVGWKEQFKAELYDRYCAMDNQDDPLEDYPAVAVEVLEKLVGPRHPTVIAWRNDAITQCIAIAYKYCRDPESHRYLKQDLEALLTAAPQPAEPVKVPSDEHLIGTGCYQTVIERHSQPAASVGPVPDIPVGCEMTRNWSVTVCAEGTDILTLSSEYVAGVADLEPWYSTIRGCAQHLLSFVGDAAPVAQEPENAASAEPVLGRINWPTMPSRKGQSPVLFDDGYAEGWAKCMSECRKAVAAQAPAFSVSARGVGTVDGSPAELVVYFDAVPNSDDIRALHEIVTGAPVAAQAQPVSMGRLLDAAHAAVEILDMIPDDPDAQLASVELSNAAAAVAIQAQPAMPPLTEAMRAVLRNENDVYGDEDALYAALVTAAQAQKWEGVDDPFFSPENMTGLDKDELIRQLQWALNYWMPSIAGDGTPDGERCANDSYLLYGMKTPVGREGDNTPSYWEKQQPSTQDREDAERMEWICDHATTKGGGAGMDVTFRVPDSEDIRDAIDAARAAKGDHHG